MLRFFLFGIIGGIILIAMSIAVFEYQTSRPVNEHDTQIRTVRIEQGMGARAIAQLLTEHNVISQELPFLYYLWKTDGFRTLREGEYVLSPSMNIQEIVALLDGGRAENEGVWVTIPEGYRTQDIEKRLRESGMEIAEGGFVATVESLISADAHSAFGFSFLGHIPPDATLEGYLFPDTYQFDRTSPPKEVASRMLATFERKAMPLWRSADEEATGGRTLHEIVTLASLLEKEVQTFDDMRQAAGVFEKRLSVDMPLQVDATLVYLTGKGAGEITSSDKKINSPYNTYLVKGLPPGPIANPGLNAIRAALAVLFP